MSALVNWIGSWVNRNCGRKVGYWVRSVFFVDHSNSNDTIQFLLSRRCTGRAAGVTGDVRRVYDYWTSKNCGSMLPSRGHGKRQQLIGRSDRVARLAPKAN